MGWSTGFRYKCAVDCSLHGEDCLNEDLIKATADRLISDKYLQAGYEYVILDDCWMEAERDEEHRLVLNRKLFPSGMKNISDYIHSRGLKLGIYLNFGEKTPGGYPGSIFHLDIDAKTLSDWNVDYIRLDAFGSDPNQLVNGFQVFSGYLREFQKRKIHLMCEYAVYQKWSEAGEKFDFNSLAKTCDSWKFSTDITDTFSKIKDINSLAVKMNPLLNTKQEILKTISLDSGYLMLGNTGLSKSQSQLQMMLWSIWQSSLILSANLAIISEFNKKILLNKDLITINQEENTNFSRVIYNSGNIHIWIKNYTSNDYIVVFANYNTLGSRVNLTKSINDLTSDKNKKFNLKDLITGEERFGICSNTPLDFAINLSTGKIFKISRTAQEQNC